MLLRQLFVPNILSPFAPHARKSLLIYHLPQSDGLTGEPHEECELSWESTLEVETALRTKTKKLLTPRFQENLILPSKSEEVFRGGVLPAAPTS